MKNTKIEWADHTANFWSGCTKVSPGCANCYAAALSKRAPKTLGAWGPSAPRRRHVSADKLVATLNRRQEELVQLANLAGEHPPRRPRVFVNSLADWLDPEVPVGWLAELLAAVHDAPHLDFLLLTKRPELWDARVGAACSWLSALNPQQVETKRWLARWLGGLARENHEPPHNVWIGTTAEDQPRLDERTPHLLSIPARVRFLSMEPLLGPVDLDRWAEGVVDGSLKPLTGYVSGDGCYEPWTAKARRVHWVIVGGESGPKARPMHPDWARSLRDQCQAAGVAFFFKQWGEYCPGYSMGGYPMSLENGTRFELPEDENDPRVKCWYATDDEGSFCGSARVGKKAAGRLLDGVEWSQFPEVAS